MPVCVVLGFLWGLVSGLLFQVIRTFSLLHNVKVFINVNYNM